MVDCLVEIGHGNWLNPLHGDSAIVYEWIVVNYLLRVDKCYRWLVIGQNGWQLLEKLNQVCSFLGKGRFYLQLLIVATCGR